MISLAQKTYLITGATSGLGWSIAQKLDELGARLVLSGRKADKLEELGRTLADRGHILRPFDLEEVEEIPAWVKSIVEASGPLNGFVHSAGVCQILPMQALNLKRFERTMRANLFSAMMVMKALVAPACHVKNDCSVVLISSTAGVVGCAGQTLYSASKGALIALARGAALELAPLGIRVNALSPACVQTPMLDYLRNTIPEENYRQLCAMHPLGLGQPLDVAHATAFLLSEASRWITGTNLILDGGLTAA